MVKIEKEYVFEGPNGRTHLRDLFEKRRQLIIYHFMFDPSWDEGCKSCSYCADNFVGGIVHLPARNTSFAVISRTPLAKIEAFKRRMSWRALCPDHSACKSLVKQSCSTVSKASARATHVADVR
jgi:predicted dithiol-disulfide oxidoreductase (DUF899 family)